jgi:pimeloyl-ACP methyl ester carboxylesterase
MASADPAELDARVRSLEKALAAGIGRSTIEHIVTTSPGVAVRVVEFEGDGDDRPPILLLHGIASVTALALPIVAALPGRRILAVDWPGHGLSGAAVLPRGASLREHATSVLEAVTAHLGLATDTDTDTDTDTVDLIGHSMGGHFALLFALSHPDQVRRIVLLGAPGAAFEGGHAPLGMRLAAIPGLGTALLGLSTSEAATRRGFEGTLGAQAVSRVTPEAIEIAHLCSQRSQFAATVASLFRAMMTPFAARPGVALTREELATLAPPTVLVLGAADGILSSDVTARSMGAIPAAHTIEVDGGHAPWLDDPSVARAVATFLGARG